MEELSVDGRIILNWSFKDLDGEGIDWIGLGSIEGQVAGTCECGDERSCSINCEEFLDQLRNG